MTRSVAISQPLCALLSGKLQCVVIIAVACFAAGGTAEANEVAATALFQVSSEIPTLLADEGERPPRVGNYEIIKKTQIALLKSYFVLNAAVRKPEIASLPILESVDEPLAWLQGKLEVSFPHDSEILRISLRGSPDQAEQLRQLVDAVAKAYREEVIYDGRASVLATRDLLARSLDSVNKEIERKFREFHDIAREADRLESGSGQVRQELDLKRLDRVENELMRLEYELLQAEVGGGADNEAAIEKRIAELRERQNELERKLTSRAETSIELTTRQRELERLQRIADQMSLRLEIMDIEAGAPDRIRQIQPAVVGPAD